MAATTSTTSTNTEHPSIVYPVYILEKKGKSMKLLLKADHFSLRVKKTPEKSTYYLMTSLEAGEDMSGYISKLMTEAFPHERYRNNFCDHIKLPNGKPVCVFKNVRVKENLEGASKNWQNVTEKDDLMLTVVCWQKEQADPQYAILDILPYDETCATTSPTNYGENVCGNVDNM